MEFAVDGKFWPPQVSLLLVARIYHAHHRGERWWRISMYPSGLLISFFSFICGVTLERPSRSPRIKKRGEKSHVSRAMSRRSLWYISTQNQHFWISTLKFDFSTTTAPIDTEQASDISITLSTILFLCVSWQKSRYRDEINTRYDAVSRDGAK